MAEGIELYAGTVHVASFAFQALFVTKRRFRPHTLVLMFVDVKKQTAVSHSSAESEIISWDASQRMERGALQLWDCLGNIFAF